MVSDEERRRVAASLRAESGPSLTVLMCVLGVGGERLFSRLADLIDPGDVSHSRRDTVACDPTERGIDSIYEWCRGGLEGADGEEDYLYCTIMSAIEEYRHPERVTARTARPVDRGELLALADYIESAGYNEWPYGDDFGQQAIARRIRELCGEIADEIMEAIGEVDGS